MARRVNWGVCEMDGWMDRCCWDVISQFHLFARAATIVR